MKHAEALTIANDLRTRMTPFCTRVEIAGSIRRECAQVKDIEIVAVARWGSMSNGDLFGGRVGLNLLHQWAMGAESSGAMRWIKPGTREVIPWTIKPEGKYWRGLVQYHPAAEWPDSQIKLDLFLATPENFGVIFAIRTGSAEFSQALVTHAKHHTDYHVDDGHLKYRPGLAPSRTIPCTDERELFSILDLEYVEPADRMGRQSLRRFDA